MSLSIMDKLRQRKQEVHEQSTSNKAAIQSKLQTLIDDPILGPSIDRNAVAKKLESVTEDIMQIMPSNDTWLWDVLISNMDNASQAITVLSNIIIRYKGESLLDSLQQDFPDPKDYKSELIRSATNIVNKLTEDGYDIMENIVELKEL